MFTEKRKILLCDMLHAMKRTPFHFLFTLVAISIVLTFAQISLAQAPTETDVRLSKLSDRIEKRATKEELSTVQKQLDELEGRVGKIGDNTNSLVTEMRVTEVIGAGLAFIGGLFIQKVFGRLLPERDR
jgi:cell division protein FtsL